MGLHPRGVRAIRYPIYILLSIGLDQSAFTQVVIRERILSSQVIEPGNRLAVTVRADCQTTATGSYSYSYTVNNSAQSIQNVWGLEIILRVSPNSIGSLSSIAGWFPPWLTDRVPEQRICSIGWYSDSLYTVRPGDSLGGFAYVSTLLPGIGEYYAEGEHAIPLLEPEEPDSIPGYTDLTPFGPGIIGGTIVPAFSGESMTSSAILDSVNSYISHSFVLGWIKGQTSRDMYSGFVTRCRAIIAENPDPRLAARICDSVLVRVSQDSIEGILTTDACALLRVNLGFLKSRFMAGMR